MYGYRSLAALTFFCIAFLAACGGSSSGGGQPTLDEISYHLVATTLDFGAYAPPAPENEGDPQAMSLMVVPDQQVDCTGGGTAFFSYELSEIDPNDTDMSAEYNQCVYDYGALTNRTHGHYTQVRQAPRTGYDSTYRYTMDQFESRFTRGDNYFSQVMHGTQVGSFSGNLRHHYEADLSVDYDYRCNDLAENYRTQFTTVTTLEMEGGGMTYESNGTINYSGHREIDGQFTVETLEPLYMEVINQQPVSGRMRLSDQAGNSTTIEYVEGGVYINGNFYTIAELEALYTSSVHTAYMCVYFGVIPGDGGSNGGGLGDDEGINVLINGEPPLANAMTVSTAHYHEQNNHLSLLRQDMTSSTEVQLISLSLSGITGPGTYELTPFGSGFGDGTFSFNYASYAKSIDGQAAIWSTYIEGGGGSITIDTLTDNRVSGSFQLVAMPDNSGGSTAEATGTVTMEGSFDLAVQRLD
ncbi:DUF6252 family protein [Marinimicrobium alkaliphilum]|uniref:DUF6252 family protein n=1 Tax=Marinimicrobium alkaliphilum TaxID=2202654 RepID=UPI000DBA2D10|nr:DUF6252 family protein [Marinimicrobium alkaliphilum]